MAESTWFDNLTRALAGSGSRRGFLRLLAGGIVGGGLGALLPRESEAAPAAQTCNPRPRVNITSSPSTDQLTVTASVTGVGNTLRQITFNGLRNAVIDVTGVATGAGNGFVYTPPAGATQATFAVRAVDGNAVVHAPFVVADDCGNWSTFVGAGAGTLRSPTVVCASGVTTLTAAAAEGTTTLQVSDASCFGAGNKIVLDPGGPTEEALEVAGVSATAAARGPFSVQAGGTVTTKTTTKQSHPAGAVARRTPGLPSVCGGQLVLLPDGSNIVPLYGSCVGGGTCCQKSAFAIGGCCGPNQGCCDGTCVDGVKDPAQDCCTIANIDTCPTSFVCCDVPEGAPRVCRHVSQFFGDIRNCGACHYDCGELEPKRTDRCRNGECVCGSGPACAAGAECINGICCKSPNIACGPAANRVCCNAEVAYCASSGASSVCCLKSRVACSGACCAQGSVCGFNGTCTSCLDCSVADHADVATNTCRCGSGPSCNLAAGQICRNGTCACALVTNPGDQLCDVTCDSGSGSIRGTVCPSGQVCRPYNDGTGRHFCDFGGGGDPPLCTM